MKIPFNKPYLAGKELDYIQQAVSSGKISGDGIFTKRCHEFFQQRYHFRKCLLTTSCTDALEMAAILLDIQPGDEVIMPSYTFVSTANAFALRGAKIIFCDSRSDHPGMDEKKVESLITEFTKVIVPVHYAGVASEMDIIMEVAARHSLFVVEDAAQAIDSFFVSGDGTKKPLGGIGHLAAFSFHETKNIQCGEGGMLVINDERFAARSEIIREKGTNRSAFFRGEVHKYGWVDIGSSFLPSDILAAFLYSQLESLDSIQRARRNLWQRYHTGLQNLADKGSIRLPEIPRTATNNAHMFYLICNTHHEQSGLIAHLKTRGILSVFHYLSLHKSSYYTSQNRSPALLNSDHYSDTLVRLPMWIGLDQQIDYIIQEIFNFYSMKQN